MTIRQRASRERVVEKQGVDIDETDIREIDIKEVVVEDILLTQGLARAEPNLLVFVLLCALRTSPPRVNCPVG